MPKITKRTVDALHPESRERVVWDDNQRQSGIGRGDHDDPPADADGLPQDRDHDAALEACRFSTGRRCASSTGKPATARSTSRRRRSTC